MLYKIKIIQTPSGPVYLLHRGSTVAYVWADRVRAASYLGLLNSRVVLSSWAGAFLHMVGL